MSRIYYPVRFRFDHKERWLLWHTVGDAEGDEPDGVVVDQCGSVLIFRTEQSLLAYAASTELTLTDKNNSAFFNLDTVVKWINRKRPAKLDCVGFLDAWNLLTDISLTVGGRFDPDKAKTRKIYSKLFWGSNLPAVTPIGRQYTPLWPGRESRIIRKVMREGFAMFRGCVTQV